MDAQRIPLVPLVLSFGLLFCCLAFLLLLFLSVDVLFVLFCCVFGVSGGFEFLALVPLSFQASLWLCWFWIFWKMSRCLSGGESCKWPTRKQSFLHLRAPPCAGTVCAQSEAMSQRCVSINSQVSMVESVQVGLRKNLQDMAPKHREQAAFL